MATSTKKKPAAKKAPAKSKSASTAQSKFTGRDAVGVVFIVFAFLFILSWFLQAVLLKFFANVGTGLFGYGYYILPIVMLIAAFFLLFKKTSGYGARTVCALLLAPFAGMFGHLCKNGPAAYEITFKSIASLYRDGVLLESGGAFSGFFASAFAIAISRPGAFVLVIVAFIVCLMVALKLSFGIFPGMFKKLFGKREKTPKEKKQRREEADEPTAPIRMPVAEQPTPAVKKRAFYDIPVDDNGAPAPEPKAPAAPPEPLPMTDTPAAAPAAVKAAADESEEIPEEAAVPAKTKQEIAAEDKKVSEQMAKLIDKNLGEAAPAAYQYPPIDLLTPGSGASVDGSDEIRENIRRLSETLSSFAISAQITNATRGPSVTRYEVVLDKGVKLSKLTGLADDIALSLGSSGVRIAPIPNKISMVGIEVPNKAVSTVMLRDIIASKEFQTSSSKLTFAVGKNIGGENIVGNIARLPHMLIAGTTGSGKSVCMNSIILSLLYKASPSEVRLIMIDPKMVELGIYNGIPHLLVPVVTDPKKASGALQWAVVEMMKRYKLFSEAGVRDISGYNQMCERTGNGEKIPQVVVVIDELADLMMVAAKEVEESICRVAQMGRASGMHLIIATQRPSADVITGLMKANIPSRIALVVANAMESRIILDNQGAEKLVGNGDMLYLPLGSGKPTRVQGTFVTDQEREDVIEFVKKSGSASYDDDVIAHMEKAAEDKNHPQIKDADPSAPVEDDCDELLPAAVDVILETGQASVSMLQRRLKLGYSRAARLVDQMEERGIVGPFEGSKPRQMLITKEQWQEMKARGVYSGKTEEIPQQQTFEDLATIEEMAAETETYDEAE
ncbi:MAG: DNA translocase FtsK [Oscillospiraceae bacterium]|nr:DNA translocase FtsK [Oscillospiraceae bacterium]